MQLYDWLQCNRYSVYTTLRDDGSNKEGILPTSVFKDLMNGMRVPLSGDEWDKLLKTYDKKGEGSINWNDMLTDHKYIHAVRAQKCSVPMVTIILLIYCLVRTTSWGQMMTLKERKRSIAQVYVCVLTM